MSTRRETLTRSHVELTPIGPTYWRVCDDRFDSGDVSRVVGYLQGVDDEYEMLWMRPRPGALYRYPTMEAAVAAIATRLELTSHPR
jgi:hypothetical protein